MPEDKVRDGDGGGKWTPGEWRIKEGPRHAPDCCDLTICGDIFMLADIRGPNYAHCEANARLIAAAPAMAEALRGVLRVADRNTVEFAAARAALVLAEGGEG